MTTTVTAQDNSPKVLISEAGRKGDPGTNGTDGAGFNQVRKSLIDNPLCHLFKTNKLTEASAPTGTDSDVAWARSTTGTYVDRCKKIKTASIDSPREEESGFLIEGESTNLLLRSEEFDDGSWVKTRSSITTDATSSPDGNTTADEIIEDSTASSTHFVIQSLTFTSIENSVSVYAKKNTRDEIRIVAFDGSTSFTAYFDVDTGVIGATQNLSDSKIEPLYDGWFRCTISFIPSASIGTVAIRLAVSGSDSYSGDGVSSLYLWGAQNEELPFSTSYISTTSASATRASDIVDIPVLDNFTSQNNSDHSQFLTLKTIGDTGSSQRIYATGVGGVYFLNVASGSVIYRDGSTSSASSPSITYGDAISVAAVTSGDSIQVYANSIPGTSTLNTPTSDLDTSNGLDIGNTSGVALLFGYIKDFRVYDFSLNKDEITYLSGQ